MSFSTESLPPISHDTPGIIRSKSDSKRKRGVQILEKWLISFADSAEPVQSLFHKDVFSLHLCQQSWKA